MKNSAAPVVLASCIALVTLPAWGQIPTHEPTPVAVTKPAAYIYLQNHVEVPTNTTVTLYEASPSGELTKAGTYTLDPVVKLIGSTGKYLIAGDSEWSANVWVYAVEPNGAIGRLVSTVNALNYFGSECPPETSPNDWQIYDALLDHSGKYLYVLVYNNSDNCSAWESFEIGANGDLIFLGVTPGNYAQPIDTISGSDTFAYGVGGYSFYAYRRDSFGVWEPDLSFRHLDPTPGPSPESSENNFSPLYVEADPAGHLAVLLEGLSLSSDSVALYLASYTIDESTGDIRSANTWKDMPVTQANGTAREIDTPTFLEMSPSGKFLTAYAGDVGFQVYHFNGAAPITPLSKLIPISPAPHQVAWDNNDNLYVSTGYYLHVYTVRSTGVTEAKGSPYSVDEYPMVIVSNPGKRERRVARLPLRR